MVGAAARAAAAAVGATAGRTNPSLIGWQAFPQDFLRRLPLPCYAFWEVAVKGRTNNPFEKRKKELARQQKKKEKAERRVQRDKERQQRGPLSAEEEDPDIAGIVPGPQAPPEEPTP